MSPDQEVSARLEKKNTKGELTIGIISKLDSGEAHGTIRTPGRIQNTTDLRVEENVEI